MKLLLAGFKGVGKTSAGRLVAEKLHLPFFDTDELLTLRYKKSIKTLHQELEEENFRSEEAKVLEELKEQKKIVIALGGGTLVSKKAQEIASDMGSLVYLYSSLERLIERLEPASFLDPEDPEGSFRQVFEARHPIFCRTCQYRIDVDTLSLDEIAHTILDFYG